LPRFLQRALFCRVCGAQPAGASFCPPCYGQARRSARFFAGQRETVLARDGRRCQACGAGNQRVVHHRRPGVHDPAWLVTICPACHAVIHRLQAKRRWLPAPLVELWREQHPDVSLQLQFPIAAATAAAAERAR
jgi:hypothetical protein